MVFRVAFVLSRLDCNDGVASHIQLLGSQLIAKNVELTMICGVIKDEQIARQRYDDLRRMFTSWYNIDDRPLRFNRRSIKKIWKILRHGDFDVIHVHGLANLPLVRLALLGTRRPTVATYHPSAHGKRQEDFEIDLSLKKRVSYFLFLTMFRPDALIALSSFSHSLFTQKCWVPNVAKVICGIDTQHFRLPSEQERIAARKLVDATASDIVCVLPGRLNLNKGHDVVISAFNILAKELDMQVKCLFVGAGPQESEIKELVKDSVNPKAFRLTGYVPDMRAIYWASDIAVLPSRSEGFAIAMAEAMACGCSAIRTPSGGSTDQIIEGVTGYTIDFNDPEGLAEKIKALCSKSFLPSVRLQVSNYASDTFSANRMADETITVYYKGIMNKR